MGGYVGLCCDRELAIYGTVMCVCIMAAAPTFRCIIGSRGDN